MSLTEFAEAADVADDTARQAEKKQLHHRGTEGTEQRSCSDNREIPIDRARLGPSAISTATGVRQKPCFVAVYGSFDGLRIFDYGLRDCELGRWEAVKQLS